MAGFIDLTGQTFNKLEVIERDSSIPKGNRNGVRWLCKCKLCNAIVSKSCGSLRHDKDVSCGNHRGDKHWTGCGDISGTYWLQIKHRCLQKNREFSITIEEAWNLFLKQNRLCALTGRPLRFTRNYSSRCTEQSASLDRIDSNIGYTLENCQWIDKTVNKMKHTVHSDEFIKTCIEVTDFHRSKT